MMSAGSHAAAGNTDALIAEYVCGLLKPEEHAQVHLLLSRDDRALELALAWEEKLLALVDALPRVSPDPAVRERLQRTLGIGPPPAVQPPPQPQLLRQRSREMTPPIPGQAVPGASPRREPAVPVPPSNPATATPDPVHSAMMTSAMGGTAMPHEAGIRAAAAPSGDAPNSTPPHRATQGRKGQSDELRYRSLARKLWLWRLVGVSATVAAIVGFMMPGEPPPPPVQIVKVAPTRAAILQAPGTTSTPGWTATLDPQGNLMMRPLVHTEVPAGQQTLLWTRSQKIPEPRLLGRIDPNRAVQVPAARLGALAADQLLEITLEREEDAAQGLPNGPILFIGQMTVFGSEAAAAAGGGEAASATAGPGAATAR